MIKWRIVFIIPAVILLCCGIIYIIFGSAERQPWDDPNNSKDNNTVLNQTNKDLNSIKTIK